MSRNIRRRAMMMRELSTRKCRRRAIHNGRQQPDDEKHLLSVLRQEVAHVNCSSIASHKSQFSEPRTGRAKCNLKFYSGDEG